MKTSKTETVVTYTLELNEDEMKVLAALVGETPCATIGQANTIQMFDQLDLALGRPISDVYGAVRRNLRGGS